MPNRNIHEVCGHLGHTPEVHRSKTSGRVYCRLSVATNNSYKKDGAWVETPPSWHRVTIWGELGDLVSREFDKGGAIMVRGKSHTRKYTDNDGVEKYATEITAWEIYKPVYVARKQTGPEPVDPDCQEGTLDISAASGPEDINPGWDEQRPRF